MVCIIMADPSPSVIYWGEEATTVYNEAYTPLIGQKHPSLMGADAKTGFAEIWDPFAETLRRGRETGRTIIGDNRLLLLHRSSFLEETYFSWKFIPMVGDEGSVVGFYATVVETTREVINDRRMSTIQALSRNILSVKTVEELWPQILRALEENEQDAPLVLLYSVPKESTAPQSPDALADSPTACICILEGSLGVPEGHAAAPALLDLESDGGFAPAFRAATDGHPQILRAEDGTLPEGLLENITWRGFGVPCNIVVVSPVYSTIANEMLGFIVIGLNPRRPYDADYQGFIDLLVSQVASPHVSAVILEEDARRRQAIVKQAAATQAKLSAELSARTKEFKESEAKFASFAMHVPVGLAILNADGAVVYANEHWYVVAREPRDTSQVDGWSWMDSVYPEDKPQVEEVWTRLLRDKLPVTFQVRLRTYPTSTETSEKHVAVLCSAHVDLDDDGNIIRIMACLTDVSELKTVEHQLRLRTRELEWSENQWKQFADVAPLGVCRFDAKGRLEFANPAWYNITGESRADDSPGSWLSAIHSEDRASVEAAFACCREDQAPSTVVFRMKRRWQGPPGHVDNNSARKIHTTILASAAAIFNKDHTVRYVAGWLTDISAQKAAEDVLRGRMTEALELKRQQENFIDVSAA
jgi:PAS domain-containing protein